MLNKIRVDFLSMKPSEADMVEMLDIIGLPGRMQGGQSSADLWNVLDQAMKKSCHRLKSLPSQRRRILYVIEVCEVLLLLNRSRQSAQACGGSAVLSENVLFNWMLAEWMRFARQQLQPQPQPRSRNSRAEST